MEGAISKESVSKRFSEGFNPSGDLIPWTIGQQFQENSFPSLSGVRIVRIAVHPNYQGMGYGTRALHLLETYYKGLIPALDEFPTESSGTIDTVSEDEINLLEEKIKPRKDLPPLLLKLSERRAEKMDWMGTSFGLTAELLKFWKRSGYIPVYLCQKPNEITGEHNCIMLKMIETNSASNWLEKFFVDFRRRFISLLGYDFRVFSPLLVSNILGNHKGVSVESANKPLNWDEVQVVLTKFDLRRLDSCSRNMVDYHLVTDLMPKLAYMYFAGQIENFQLSAIQRLMLLAVGLQFKSIDDVSKDPAIQLPHRQLSGLYGKMVKKFVGYFNKLAEQKFEAEIKRPNGKISVEPIKQTLDEDLDEAVKEYNRQTKANKESIKGLDLDQYKIAALDAELDVGLKGKRKAGEPSTGFDANSSFQTKRKKNHGKDRKGKHQRKK